MRKRVLLFAVSFVATAIGLSNVAQAATINVTPDSVNRVIAGPHANQHFAANFSTDPSNNQKTLVETTDANINAALLAQLGALGAGESYQINSATLTVAGGLLPATTIRDVIVDPDDWKIAYAVDDTGHVFKTIDTGANWSEVTGNLRTLLESASHVRTGIGARRMTGRRHRFSTRRRSL